MKGLKQKVICLGLCLLVVLAPLGVYAGSSHSSGTLTKGMSFKETTPDQQGTGYRWDQDTRTLTLSGICMIVDKGDAIQLPDEATLYVAPGTTNRIQCEGTGIVFNKKSISPKKEPLISGSGTLRIESEETAIMALSGQNLSIRDCNLNINSRTGIEVDYNLSLKNASITIVSEEQGIHQVDGAGVFYIDRGIYHFTSKKSDAICLAPIERYGKEAEIRNATVIVRGAKDGIRCYRSDLTLENSVVTAQGKNIGIRVENGSIEVKGNKSKVEAKGERAAILTGKKKIYKITLRDRLGLVRGGKIVRGKKGNSIYVYTASTAKKLKLKKNGENYPTNASKRIVISKKARPYKVSINKITSARHVMNIRWQKNECRGYQVQYAENKKFKKGTKTINVPASKKSKKVKHLERKEKYFVRVRAYNYFDGKKCYGKWSEVKTIRTK